MITAASLNRIPSFAPVRREMAEWVREKGPLKVRVLLDRAAAPPKPAIQNWLNSSPDPGARAQRYSALYVVLEELNQ
jgi:hypothetical protein